MESNSCAGIEMASTVLLRALRATPDEGVRGYIFVLGTGSQNPHPVAQNATRVGHPFLDVFQPTGFACRFYFGEPVGGEIEEGDRDCPDCVQEGEAPGVSVRWFGVAHGEIGEEPRAYVA